MRLRGQALDRLGHHRALPVTQRVERGGHGAQLRRLEQRAQRQRHAEAGAQLERELGGQQRMAAQFEEAVERAHLVHLQQLAPQLGELRLGAGRRLDVLVTAKHVLVRGLRQALAVHLAVGVEREAVHQHEGGRHHVARHALGHEGTQLGHGRRRVAMRDHVAEQVEPLLRITRGHHHCLAHVVVIADRLLDLADLDALAANLHLEVLATEELERAARAVARQVAGLVEPAAGLRRERIGQEGARRAQRVAQVAAAHAGAADIDLARHAERHRFELCVEQVGAQVRQGALDRHIGQRGAERLADPQMAGVVRALGRAVGIDHRDMRHAGEPALAERGRERLGIADVDAHARQALDARARFELVDQDLHVRGHRLEHRHALGIQLREQLLRIPGRVAGDHRGAPAHQQRHQVLPDRHVEGGDGHLGHHVPLADAEVVDLGQQVVEHAELLDHRALGQAGGARGVDHVGQRGRRERQEGARRGRFAQQRVERHALGGHVQCLRAAGAGRVVQHVAQLAELGHTLQLGQRIGRVQRREREARLQHAEHRHQVAEIAAEQQPDQGLVARAEREQVVGHAIGGAVQLGVGHGTIAAARRDALGHARGLPREQLAHRQARLQRPARLVERLQLIAALVLVEQRQRVQRRARIGGHARQQMAEVRGQALHRGGLEQVGAVLEAAMQPAVQRPGGEIQVELRAAMLGFEVAGVQAVEAGRLQRGAILVREHGLEQAAAVAFALAVDGRGDLLERDVLVVEGFQAGGAHRVEQLGEARRGLGAQPHHQRVDEEADHRLELGPPAAQRRHADQQVVLAGVARQQRRVGRQQQHEHRDVVTLRHRLQPRGQRRVQLEGEGRTRAARLWRPGMVGGQLQHRQRAVEPRAPVVELAFALAAVEQAAVPVGEVAVLQRARGRVGGRERRCPADARLVVVARQALLEQGHRPAVDHDVMEHRQQRVFLAGQPDQAEACQRPAFEVEGRAELALHQRVERGAARLGRERREVVARQLRRGRRVDHL